MSDDLAARRKIHAVRMAHASGRRRRVEIGDVVVYDPTRATSQVRGVWQDGPSTRVLVDLDGGQAWVLSSDCTVTQEATDA